MITFKMFKLIQTEEMLLKLMKYCSVKLCWAKQIFHMSYDSSVVFKGSFSIIEIMYQII